jgi:outer membrane protein assembly factor BamD (BamD/ComL family)
MRIALSLSRPFPALLGAVLILAFAAAGYSGPVSIPEDLSAAELVQRAQEASGLSRYNQAFQYYQAILDRYPDDIEMRCAAEYEIAFIHYKQKDYETAQTEFNALLERYTGPDAAQLPPKYQILSKSILAEIAEKQ